MCVVLHAATSEFSRAGAGSSVCCVALMSAVCAVLQSAAVCTHCHTTMGEYFCPKCNLFDDNTTKQQFHCDACGICRYVSVPARLLASAPMAA